ncbi:MAG: sigma-70 family RNA polymerase sigma factor [Caulobacterales bacterium]|nr:sigma-70 family RNA polymerase sigma factor [Caulobacterales bacterium]
MLVKALLRMSVQPGDVDDILQEALARTLEADGKKALHFPKSYLFTVSRNMVFREQERSSREVQCEIDEALLASNAVPVDDEIYYKQMLQAFWDAVDSLPKNHKRAILLRRLYGFSQKDIAKKMGVSLSSVEKYFAQGIKRCQDVMSRRGFDMARLERTASQPATKGARAKAFSAAKEDHSNDE